ncbi:transketolase [Clostridium sp. 'deep sea']|uniref:transketolase n=1 Tax=Clostridium sp. 'deep sea' TaxID=2779445 RepID=UPI0018969CFB|nr:transketolase [Clostridium sp. 'deep sea']QOR33681.1 transketolase [Clostridium sp. 'deep sea']
MSYQNEKLMDIAQEMRRNIVSMIGEAGSGHPGGSLSSADIVTALYFKLMNIKPQEPEWAERDRFVLSKGHAAPVLYSALAMREYFDIKELKTLRKLGSPLQGHPDMKKLAGVEMSTGSLGQGLSTAVGMALAGKIDNKEYYTYSILGDGEVQEGQIWEAAMFASHNKLGKLIVFLDFNGLQIDGKVQDVMGIDPLPEKWSSFGWHVLEINGHDFEQICNAVNQAKLVEDKPSIIIASTIKGKGVSFMENEAGWHGNAPSTEQVTQALNELGGKKHE